MNDLYFNKSLIPKNYSSWMSLLPNSINIKDLAIPGTHDSCAINFINYGLKNDYVKIRARNQRWSLDEQLQSGIRYLDLRPGYKGLIYHSKYITTLTFEEVFQILKIFLQSHPTETVILRIQFNYKTCQIEIEECKKLYMFFYLDKYSYLFYNGEEALPNLGKLRGKIFPIIEKFVYKNYMVWNNKNMILQDYYLLYGKREDALNLKKNSIKQYLFNQDNNKLIVNHCSAVGKYIYTTLLQIAYTTNKVPYDNQRFRGILPMDFPGELNIVHIINQNFEK